VLIVLWRLQYQLSLRNVAEMFLTRGFSFTHETVREWEERFAPLLTARLKAKRRGKAGRKWHVDETYVKVAGRWCYLYRAIDSDGNLVETMLSKTRDMDAAKRFFACALKTVGEAPQKVTTDGHDSYPRAIRETLGPDVRHRTSRSMNNRIEQDHRGIKQRYYPMRGFGSFDAAARFRTAHDELRDHLRPRTHFNEAAPWPTNAASSRSAGERCAHCSRLPNHPGHWSLPAQRRLSHQCGLKSDAFLQTAERRNNWTTRVGRMGCGPVPAALGVGGVIGVMGGRVARYGEAEHHLAS